MRVKIIANNAHDYYNQFIGTEHDVLEYDKRLFGFKLPIKSHKNEDCSWWYKFEVEVIEED